MAHVFISCSSEDRQAAQEICRSLEERNIKCWIAPRDIVAGKNYAEQIIAAIEQATVVLLILSANANTSAFVKREVERAVTNQKAIITFRIQDTKPSKALELYVHESQWIDAWGALLQTGLVRLIEAVRQAQPGPPAPTGQPGSAEVGWRQNDSDAVRLREIARAMLASTSTWELEGLSFEVGTIAARNPGDVEARRLQRKLEEALRCAAAPVGYAPRVGWRWLVRASSFAFPLVLVVVGLLWLAQNMALRMPSRLPPVASPPMAPHEAANTIAVMEFENLRADDRGDDWYCKALQTNFYTELSKMPQLQIIAPEIIQRVSKESGLDYMAAAKQLGAGRVIAGSFAAKDNILYIGVRILETTTGHQQTAEKIEGDQNQFFDLQNRLARTTLEHFNVRLTAAQEASLHTETSAKPVPLNKYRQFLGAEGVNTETSAPDPTPPGPQARQPLAQTEAPRDDARRWAGLLPWTAAYAQAPPAANEAAALQLLEEYRRAQEGGNLDRLASLYVAFPNSQRQTISAYLKGVAKLRVELRDVKIEPHGQDLAVSYIRRDSFVDKDSGEPVSLEVRVTKFLVQDSGKWKFAEGG